MAVRSGRVSELPDFAGVAFEGVSHIGRDVVIAGNQILFVHLTILFKLQ